MRGLAAVDTDDFLTASEAAELIGISRSTIRRAVARGYLAGWHTPGRHLRVARASCLDFAHSLGRAELIGRPDGDSQSATDGSTAVGASGALEAGHLHPSRSRAETIDGGARSSE